jgi:adenylate kinase family enzyme
MNKIVNKLYIVGSAGSGKSTLALKLSKKLRIEHYDLDLIRLPLTGIKRTFEERAPLVNEIAKKKKWIAEGVYVAWTKELLESANQIIWLDTPLHKTIPRIFKRFIHQKITGTERYGIKSTLRMTRALIKHHYPDSKFKDSIEDKHITKEKVKNALTPYMDKVLILKSNNEIKNYINELL